MAITSDLDRAATRSSRSWASAPNSEGGQLSSYARAHVTMCANACSCRVGSPRSSSTTTPSACLCAEMFHSDGWLARHENIVCMYMPARNPPPPPDVRQESRPSGGTKQLLFRRRGPRIGIPRANSPQSSHRRNFGAFVSIEIGKNEERNMGTAVMTVRGSAVFVHGPECEAEALCTVTLR